MDQRPTAGRRRSAFAAAAFSLLFPGLGHAYLGRWSRALAWAVLPILLIALVSGLWVSPGTRELLLEAVLTDGVLTGLLVLVAIDLVYRLLCVLDAWRIARMGVTGRATGNAAGAAVASVAGLVAVILVLGGSHVAVARPVMVALGTLQAINPGPGEEEEPSLDPALLASLQPKTPPPTATPDPSFPAEPTPTPEPTPTQGPRWDEGGRLSVLLVGTDGGRPGGGSLTDTMIVVTVDTRTKQSAFISIPRDMQGVPIPREWPAAASFGGVFPYSINLLAVTARGNPDAWAPGAERRHKGFAALKGVLGELYGLDIDYYVAVDLSGFRGVIDALGGAMIDVQIPVFDYHYPADDGHSGHMKIYVQPGIQYMGGRDALAYARARKLTSDFDRADRQQRVVTSVREQVDLSALLAPGVIEDLLRTVRSDIRTDIPVSKIPKLAQLAQEIDLDERISLVLTPPTFGSECYLQPACAGDYELVANVGRIRSAVSSVFKADREEARTRQKLLDEGAVVHVLNGSRLANTRTSRVADALAGLGLDAIVPPVAAGRADRDDYAEAVIIAWNGARDELPLAGDVLARELGVTVEQRDDPLATSDYTVIVGASTTPPD